MTDKRDIVFIVYGLVVSSPYRFHTPVYPSAAEPDFFFDFCDHPPWAESVWEQAAPLNSNFDDQYDMLEVRRHEDDYLFRLVDMADYRIGATKITGYVYREDERLFAEKELFDSVLPTYLELRGKFVLHASAVEIDGGVYAFTAHSGQGKSSLAAGLVRRGCRFVADDRVVIEETPTRYEVLPGYPQLRLWADAAGQFVDANQHPIIHPEWQKHLVSLDGLGTFQPQPRPLAGVYMVDCQPDYKQITMTPLRGHAGLIKFLHSSSILTANMDVQAKRLETVSNLLQRVPVKIFSYPADYARFEQALDALLADIRTN